MSSLDLSQGKLRYASLERLNALWDSQKAQLVASPLPPPLLSVVAILSYFSPKNMPFDPPGEEILPWTV